VFTALSHSAFFACTQNLLLYTEIFMLTKELRAFTLMINLDMVEEKILEFRSFKTNFFFYFLYRIINYFVSVHYNSHISLYGVSKHWFAKIKCEVEWIREDDGSQYTRYLLRKTAKGRVESGSRVRRCHLQYFVINCQLFRKTSGPARLISVRAKSRGFGSSTDELAV